MKTIAAIATRTATARKAEEAFIAAAEANRTVTHQVIWTVAGVTHTENFGNALRACKLWRRLRNAGFAANLFSLEGRFAGNDRARTMVDRITIWNILEAASAKLQANRRNKRQAVKAEAARLDAIHLEILVAA